MVNLKTFSASLDVDLVVGNILIRVLYSWQISTSLINKRFLRNDIFVVKFYVNCVTSYAWNTFNVKSISYITAYEIVNNVILINLANGYNTKRNVIVFINIYCWICGWLNWRIWLGMTEIIKYWNCCLPWGLWSPLNKKQL